MTTAEFNKIMKELREHKARTSFPAVDTRTDNADRHAEYGGSQH